MRFLSILTLIIGCIWTSNSFALTLGQPQLQSMLGEPVRIILEIKHHEELSPHELLVDLADEKQYQQLHVARHAFHHNLKFTIDKRPDGKKYLLVSSHKAYSEPYLNFVVLIRWPNGELLKEIAVLLDTPEK
jgi:pilus assembly protein FimV